MKGMKKQKTLGVREVEKIVEGPTEQPHAHQTAWWMVLSAKTIESEQFIYLLVFYSQKYDNLL